METKLLQTDFTRCYEGYFWLSDSPAPLVFRKDRSLGDYLKEYGKSMEEIIGQINPYIVEGLLFDPKAGLSHSLKFIDGEYLLISTEVTSLQVMHKVKTYLAHRMPGVEKLKFIRLWIEEKDELCENMPVLKPVGQVFVGFQ